MNRTSRRGHLRHIHHTSTSVNPFAAWPVNPLAARPASHSVALDPVVSIVTPVADQPITLVAFDFLTTPGIGIVALRKQASALGLKGAYKGYTKEQLTEYIRDHS